MMPSDPSSKPRLTPIPKWLSWSFLLLSLLGFSDAVYLTIKHYTEEIPACSILAGCDVVVNSVYATIGLVPLALIGTFYYLGIALLTIAYLDTKHPRLLILASILTIFGFLASLILIFLQLNVLHAVCLYCMFSALVSILLFSLGLIVLHRMTPPPP